MRLSPQKIMHAMREVNKELVVHFECLADPSLDPTDRAVIGRNAAEGVRRGFQVVVLHQMLLAQRLDELEEQALASGVG